MKVLSVVFTSVIDFLRCSCPTCRQPFGLKGDADFPRNFAIEHVIAELELMNRIETGPDVVNRTRPEYSILSRGG